MDSLLAIYRAVLNGAGVGAASPWLCHADIQAGRLKRMLANWCLEPVDVHIALPPAVCRLGRNKDMTEH